VAQLQGVGLRRASIIKERWMSVAGFTITRQWRERDSARRHETRRQLSARCYTGSTDLSRRRLDDSSRATTSLCLAIQRSASASSTKLITVVGLASGIVTSTPKVASLSRKIL